MYSVHSLWAAEARAAHPLPSPPLVYRVGRQEATMRKAALLTLAATPGVAFAYFVLLAYILNRVRPLPITVLPDIAAEPHS